MIFASTKARSEYPRFRLQGESIFAFLDRSARSGTSAARARWNQAVSLVPSSLEAQYRTRLVSRDDENCLGAYFEIRLHHDLNVAGLTVSINPPASSGSSPDIVLSDTVPRVHIEAKLKLASEGDRKQDLAIHSFLCNASRHVRRREVRIWLRRIHTTNRTPSAKAFARWIDEKAEQTEETLEYQDPAADWCLWLRIIDVPEQLHPKGSIYAGGPVRMCRTNAPSRLKKALSEKTAQHRGHCGTVVPALAWNDFGDEPAIADVARVCAELSNRRNAPVELLWCGACYPWDAVDLSPMLVATHTDKSVLWDIWPPSRRKLALLNR